MLDVPFINPTQQGGEILKHIYGVYVASLSNCQIFILPVLTSAFHTNDILHLAILSAETSLSHKPIQKHMGPQKLRKLEDITQKY